MVTKPSVFWRVVATSWVLIVCGSAAPPQDSQPLFLLPDANPRTPLVQSNHAVNNNVGRGSTMSLRSINGKNVGKGPARRFGRMLDLNRGKVDPGGANVTTIPRWSDSFTYNGLVYKYTMVGTDPKRGSATTVIPTVLIPLRFVFADGNVFDATTDIVNGLTPIQGIVHSPIFQNYDFNNNTGTYYFGGATGLVKVGNTQFGDAFQRANFWDSVSTRAPNYHVLLGQPTVLPTQTINVPAGSFSYYFDPVSGETLPLVDDELLFDITNPILTAANVSATASHYRMGQSYRLRTGGIPRHNEHQRKCASNVHRHRLFARRLRAGCLHS